MTSWDGSEDGAAFRERLQKTLDEFLDENGNEVAPGSGVVGLIARKGHIPVGYYKDEKKSAETFKTFNGIRYSIPGDFATALFTEAVLEKEPGAKIIYDVRASWAVPETIERNGGIPLVNRVGHAFIKHRMREEDAAFAGEVSGHYYFRDFSQADSGVVPFLLMLEIVSKKERKLSEILRPFRDRYFITGELNTPVPDVALKLQELKERFGTEGRVSHLDGISVDAPDWHMNVRPSNTEPLLRLNLEARTPELMERKRDEVLAVIGAGG